MGSTAGTLAREGVGEAMELGIYTFGEVTPEAGTGQAPSPAQRLRDLVEEIELADEVGLDVFGVGEHHRPEFVVSSPAVVLRAIELLGTVVAPAVRQALAS